jgi:1,4-alpha-glucan branching enzyme
VEIITTAATHGLLPLMQNHPPSLRAQVLIARDHYRSCFGVDPRGIWLPECAYTAALDEILKEANIRWFVLDTHGVLLARPRPRYGVFSPLFTPNGLAVFGRDIHSAEQVWSKHAGYPGDARYRDFYRDIGYDLEFEYLKPYLPALPNRSFTGIKYCAISGPEHQKVPYNRQAALEAAGEHSEHFLRARINQLKRLSSIMDHPPIVVSPYDAELFGHWWYEGPEFIDFLMRKICFDQKELALITPEEYLREHDTHQVAQPSPSSWGEEGYWKLWLNESNEWLYLHLYTAQNRMTELAEAFPAAEGILERALKQAGRELLLAQSSDWPFILRTGSSPGYARQRAQTHLLRFLRLHDQVMGNRIDKDWLAHVESRDNLFPNLDYRYWRSS